MRCVVPTLVIVLTPALAQAQDLSFVTVSPDNGLAYPQGSSGFTVAGAVGDHDGDGWLDVLLYGGPEGVKLYHNERDGTFKDVTGRVLPADLPNAAMALFADIDGDGDEDISIVVWHDTHVDTSYACLVNHDGRYRWLPGAGPHDTDIARFLTFSGSLTMSDVDSNGTLDVVRMCYTGPGFCLSREHQRMDYSTGARMAFFDRTGRFGGGIDQVRRHWAGVMADYNNDGLQDLHCAVDVGPDYQARNTGGGVFVDVSNEANVTNVGQDMGLTVGDIDDDGDLDIFSSNIEFHVLYVNDGTGVFHDLAAQRGVLRNTTPSFDWGWGTMFTDLDNDGDLDLAMMDSGPGMICVNDGTGYFDLDESDNGAVLSGLGLVAFDYDRDGDEDLLATGRIGFAKLLENRSPALENRHWLVVNLRGTRSNSAAVGTRVYATIDGVRRMREIVAGQSFVSGPPLYAHFGLGDERTVDLLEIHWPSGNVQIFRHVEGDRYVDAVEGQNWLTERP